MRLILLCSAALLGLAIGDLEHLAVGQLLFGGLVALLGAALAWRHPTWRWVALSTCALAMGAVRASTLEGQLPPILEPYIGQVIRVSGTLVDPPALSSTGAAVRLLLEVDVVNASGLRADEDSTRSLKARLNVVGEPAVLGSLGAGDTVLLDGRVTQGDARSPPTLFFPRLLERTASEASSPLAWIANLRVTAAAGIHRYLPEPQASLSAGVLLGGSGQLDPEFRLQLQRSGLAHLVAIDGYKQVVVAAALGAVSVRVLGAPLATLPIILGIAGYTLLTGAHPSAVRAGLMVGLASVASVTGRVADPLTSLVVAALAMAVLDPRILLDVGLQLSLSATLGIILLWPRLRRRLRGVPSFVAEPVGLTVAVTMATLPVTLSVFQSVSLVSPVAHILAVPLLPLVLASTAVLGAVSALEPLATAVAWVAWLPSSLLVEVVRFFGSVPGAALSTGRLPVQAALGLAVGLLIWGLWGLPEAAGLRLRLARLRLGQRPEFVPAASVCACLVAIATLQLVRPDGRLHVYALQAGRGTAVLIRGPTGRTALVAAGRVDAVPLAGQVADHLAVWEHKLDDVISLDLAAEAGLAPVLARYPADQRSAAGLDEQVDLGAGAVLDVYGSPPNGQVTVDNALDTPPGKRVSVSFGSVRVWLLGQPQTAATQRAWELVSEGAEVWAVSEAE